MNISSFEKGELFEKFVETILFPDKDYVLIHRTESYEKNKERFSEETLRPDNKFRCRKTNKEFYIEAKFRSRFNENDKLVIRKQDQFSRFRGIQQTEKIPVYFVIGYEGTPTNPMKISLIPLEELIYDDLYPSFLRMYNIDKDVVKSEKLKLDAFNYKVCMGGLPQNPIRTGLRGHI